MKFSDRIDITTVDATLQVNGMNEALRNSLWNALDMEIFGQTNFKYSSHGGTGQINSFSRSLWINYFKIPVDSRPDKPGKIMEEIRSYFFQCEWYEVYNFIEFVLKLTKSFRLYQLLNAILQREFAGYRIIDKQFVPVTDEQEIEAVQMAIAPGLFSGASSHIKQSLSLLSNKENPDYRNSIKESISAVESAAREICGNSKATLGDALSKIEKQGKLHPALKRALTALYGYTSDEAGIRHAMLEEPSLSAADAKFFLVACTTFVNYMKSKI